MDQRKTGKLMANLRKEKNLTQIQLAEKLGVNHRSISRWENGHGMPDLAMLPILAQELDVDMTELILGRRRTNQELQDLRESINQILAMSEQEKKMKTKKLNRSILIGLACLIVTLLQQQFSVLSWIFRDGVDEFLDGFLSGLAIVFLLVGLYNNNHGKTFNQRKREFFTKFR